MYSDHVIGRSHDYDIRHIIRNKKCENYKKLLFKYISNSNNFSIKS